MRERKIERELRDREMDRDGGGGWEIRRGMGEEWRVGGWRSLSVGVYPACPEGALRS